MGGMYGCMNIYMYVCMYILVCMYVFIIYNYVCMFLTVVKSKGVFPSLFVTEYNAPYNINSLTNIAWFHLK